MVTTIAQKRAIGYFRVSTVRQSGERHSSLETQLEHFKAYCQRNGLTVIKTFTDIVSGRRDDRKGYQEMVAYVLAGNADLVIVQFLDRFGRNPREILRRYWELEEHGVAVEATDEDIKEELTLLIRAFMAGAESRKNSERVRANMVKAILKGSHAGNPPYGFQPVKELIDGKVKTTWAINEAEASIVREMFRLATEENLGYRSIADRLTQAGYRTRSGKLFASFTIQKTLSNPCLIGTLVYGRQPRKGNPQPELVKVPDFFPAILSNEQWQRLQERFAIRREHPRGKTHSSTYLLSGILKCGNCGGGMSGQVYRDRKGRERKSYLCIRRKWGKALCDVPNYHSAVPLEQAILEYLGQFSDPQRVRELLAAGETQTSERESAELQATEKRLAELEGLLFKDIDRLDRGILSETEFAQVNKVRRAELENLKARQAELKGKVEAEHSKANLVERVPIAIRSFLEDFSSMPIQRQKAELQSILKAAYVWKNGKIELEFRE